MAAPLITAVDPITGASLTRRTARTYFAAVVIDTKQGPKALAWCGRPDLAQKRLAEIAAVNDSARLALVARPHLPGEAPTPVPATHGTAAPKLPDLNGAADKIAALEYVAGGGQLSSDVWVALGWPFEGFLTWAQRPDADAREERFRALIRRHGVAACLAQL